MCSEFETFLINLNLLAEREAQDKRIKQLEERIAQLEHSLTGIYRDSPFPVKRIITEVV